MGAERYKLCDHGRFSGNRYSTTMCSAAQKEARDKFYENH